MDVHEIRQKLLKFTLNPLIRTVKLQINGPLYSNTVIGTLAVDGWAMLHFVQRGGTWAGRAVAPPSPLLAVPYVTGNPSTSYYSMRHYNYLCAVKG